MGRDMMLKQWVDSGANSYHMTICLEILSNPRKPTNPFKLCATWLKNEEVIRLIHSNWIPYPVDEDTHAATHFAQNLSQIKILLKEWARNKKILDDQEIT